jgi:hypothetical protein
MWKKLWNRPRPTTPKNEPAKQEIRALEREQNDEQIVRLLHQEKNRLDARRSKKDAWI